MQPLGKILPTPLGESYPRVYLQAAKEKESEPSEPGRRALLSLKSKENGENQGNGSVCYVINNAQKYLFAETRGKNKCPQLLFSLITV